MEFHEDPPKTLEMITRHKCAACFKQYKKKEHLIAHMNTSCHSVHQPQCGVCHKYCKTLNSLQEHLIGQLAKGNCSELFAARGCKFCMTFLDSPSLLDEHQKTCCPPTPPPLETLISCAEAQIIDPLPVTAENADGYHSGAVAMECAMVGGGSDCSLDVCARVCLVDETEKIIFHTFVVPQIPVTDYRYEFTGITEENLRHAMPLKEVQNKIWEILYNGESITKARMSGGKAKVLVGHDVEYDLDRLSMHYPEHLLRNTAKYPPLMKTNLASHSLRFLVKTYLGYDIQSGVHDLYVDSVSVMRLYKRLRSQQHQTERLQAPLASRILQRHKNCFESLSPRELEKMTPDELFALSKPNYKCWCLDAP